jgi:HTH-type transcriptional repressor of NAD biosynthesis genes
LAFDEQRNIVPVSATQIRNDPFKYWDFIPEHARYWFVKKIALVGTESTGKSVLAEKLASNFNTTYVPEMAREIVETTSSCTFDDLIQIAQLHASAIYKKSQIANKILIADTDITITKSYSLFLFQKELVVDSWVEDANQFDLYLFLEPDCGYVQDGTRLSQSERARLSDHHKAIFDRAGISFVSIHGDWEERFQQAKQLIEKMFLI